MWFGACAYADDLCLLAPNSIVLQKMVTMCQKYGEEHNLVFSTDPVPSKSKTKCIQFRGKSRVKQQPATIILNDKPLPFVQNVEHLGHVFHESLSMESDAARARGKYKNRAADIREELFFCHPNMKMRAVQTFASDGYGFSLWSFRSYNICARLAWDISLQTHVNLIENYFCKDLFSLRQQLLSRYPSFIRNLMNSNSKEIRFLSSIVINDMRSVTARNILYLNSITKLNIIQEANWKVRLALPKAEPCESWRTSLLDTLLAARFEKNPSSLNLTGKQLTSMIESLCKT